MAIINKKKLSYYFGHFSEFISCIYLSLKLYLILHRRYKTPFGEIDLISKKNKQIVFIEVKYRKKFFHNEVISTHQQKRIKNAAIYFLNKNIKYQSYNLRFDVIFISFPVNILHIKSYW